MRHCAANRLFLGMLAVLLGTGPAWGQADDTRLLNQRLRETLGAAGVADDAVRPAESVPGDEHPLVDIAGRMHETAGRLAVPDSGAETQAAQEKILEALDAQIERARQQCRQAQKRNGRQTTAPRQPVSQPGAQGDGPGQSGTRPARASVERNGRTNGQPADLPAVRELAKRLWGELPDRQREQLLQTPIEKLLPKYETMIEQYFRRLAEP